MTKPKHWLVFIGTQSEGKVYFCLLFLFLMHIYSPFLIVVGVDF